MQLTEQRIREIVREEIRGALEERDAAKKTALLSVVNSEEFQSKIQTTVSSAFDSSSR